MLYSSAGFFALIIHLIINHDILERNQKKERVPVQYTYRAFLYTLIVFYVSDILWGVLYERQLITLVYIDTFVYFYAMGASILLWTRYAVKYLQEEDIFGKSLVIAGWLIFAFQMVVLVANIFVPILFYFDADGVYHAGHARYITLIGQIGMYLVTGIHVLASSRSTQGTMRTRYHAIGFSSVVMAGLILMQTFYPLLPLYAIGCVLSGCLLHSFVLESEKAEYTDNIESRLNENLRKGNYYDLLTGLPGMTYFLGLAKEKREGLISDGKTPAFIHIDLSGMKLYNLRHGYAKGDDVLKSFARLLVQEFGLYNCSRFGQDHFAVITKDEGLRERLADLFTEWDNLGIEDSPAIRVGIYIDNMDEVDIAKACDRAKAARDTLRGSFVSSMAYFDNEILVQAEKRRYILSHIDKAINEKQIKVYYQPIIRAYNGRVCNEEALARWDDPERGFMAPIDFIPSLEETKMIYKLDLYVVAQVIEKIKRMEAAGLHIVPQSVNLSRADFDACDMVEEITKRVDESGIDHKYIIIEITESTVGSGFEFMKKQIDRFRELGFPVWMDDFGSGYSTLDLLSNIDVDLIKFDMHFIQEFESGEKNKIVINELIKLAMALGIDTLCEGVETKEQANFLRFSGCTKLQGYYYVCPIPLEKVLERYEKGTQIGFENPAEFDYYEAIGKINLYDLSVITREDQDTFRNYFNTIPMAVIELDGARARFMRSNQAYRQFMLGMFGVDLADLGDKYGEAQEGPGLPFVNMLRQCSAEGGRAVFDETLPDGTIVHSYMRRIARNNITGTTATAVAVLAIRTSSSNAY